MRKPLIPLTPKLVDAIQSSTVITGNYRQANELRYAWNYEQVHQSKFAFRTPNIFSFDAWLVAIYDELERLEVEDAHRSLLTGAPLRLAFQICAPEKEYEQHFLSVAGAWPIYTEWSLSRVRPDILATENGKVFCRWADEFIKFCRARDLVTLAELPSFISDQVTQKRWQSPPITFFGTQQLSASRQELLNHLRDHGAGVEYMDPELEPFKQQRILSFSSVAREASAFGTWARERIAEGDESIRVGIVLPSLRRESMRIKRVLEAVFFDCHSIDSVANIGAGTPLDETRMCGDIINFLEWTTRPLSHGEVTQLGRSAYLANLYIPESFPSNFPDHFDFAEYFKRQLPEIRALLSPIRQLQQSRNMFLQDWVSRVAKVFSLIGWDAASDNDDNRRARAAMLTVLADVIKLSQFVGQISWKAAVRHIVNAIRSQNIPEQTRFAPIQVMGREESLGLQFDALWVTGNSERSWPPNPNPNPMIPIAVQRNAQVPRVTYPRSLAWAKAVTNSWARSSPEVVFSFVDDAQVHGGSPLLTVSKLIADHQHVETDLVLSDPKSTEFDHPWAQNHSEISPLREYFTDSGTALEQLPDNRLRTAVLRDQSRCPFRSWGVHRLGLDDELPPHRFPNVQERGTIIHKLLEKLLKQAPNQEAIQSLTPEAITLAIDETLSQELSNLPQVFLDRERLRLTKIVNFWREYEQRRSSFTVNAIEESIKTEIDGLTINMRVDRIDSTTKLNKLVIDIKTGLVSTSSWTGSRLKEIQMPLYAISIPECDGLAYQTIRYGEKVRLQGIGTNSDDFDNRKSKELEAIGSFEDVKAQWHSTIVGLIADYRDGIATVDPIDSTICNNCHLMSFCRQFTRETMDLNTLDFLDE